MKNIWILAVLVVEPRGDPCRIFARPRKLGSISASKMACGFSTRSAWIRLVAFRGEAVVAADIPRLAQVLSDSPRKVEWMAALAEARTLHKSNLLDRISIITLPCPGRSRIGNSYFGLGSK